MAANALTNPGAATTKTAVGLHGPAPCALRARSWYEQVLVAIHAVTVAASGDAGSVAPPPNAAPSTLTWYSYPVMAKPPLLAGAVHVSLAFDPDAATLSDGGDVGSCHIPETLALHGPVPIALTSAIW